MPKETPFIALDNRSDSYSQGYRAATKACVAWLHDASNNRGTKARTILRRAAHDMSREAAVVAAGGDDDLAAAAFRDHEIGANGLPVNSSEEKP